MAARVWWVTSGRRGDTSAMADAQTWTLAELRAALARSEQELRAAGLARNTVHTYVDRAEVFVRWLAGDYHPRGPRSALSAIGAPVALAPRRRVSSATRSRNTARGRSRAGRPCQR